MSGTSDVIIIKIGVITKPKLVGIAIVNNSTTEYVDLILHLVNSQNRRNLLRKRWNVRGSMTATRGRGEIRRGRGGYYSHSRDGQLHELRGPRRHRVLEDDESEEAGQPVNNASRQGRGSYSQQRTRRGQNKEQKLVSVHRTVWRGWILTILRVLSSSMNIYRTLSVGMQLMNLRRNKHKHTKLKWNRGLKFLKVLNKRAKKQKALEQQQKLVYLLTIFKSYTLGNIEIVCIFPVPSVIPSPIARPTPRSKSAASDTSPNCKKEVPLRAEKYDFTFDPDLHEVHDYNIHFQYILKLLLVHVYLRFASLIYTGITINHYIVGFYIFRFAQPPPSIGQDVPWTKSVPPPQFGMLPGPDYLHCYCFTFTGQLNLSRVGQQQADVWSLNNHAIGGLHQHRTIGMSNVNMSHKSDRLQQQLDRRGPSDEASGMKQPPSGKQPSSCPTTA
uniref:Transmembrane protein n=1 Tax=Heterorhabditis bacteriophora TaxID=37862 RepID=A0A1I7WZ10_HETBA